MSAVATRPKASKNGSTSTSTPIPIELISSKLALDDLGELKWHFDMVPISRMFVDRSYQRDLTSFVRRIEERFNPVLLSTLALSLRSNGKYAIIDGQTRMVAAERLGFEALPAIIFEGLSAAQEAEIFSLLGTERRNVTGLNRWRAELRYNPETKQIDKLVKSLGLQIGPDSTKHIGAVTALKQCYRKDPTQLERTLVDLKDAWPDIPPPGDMIKGLHAFFTPAGKRLREERLAVDDDKLVRRLKGAGPDQIRHRANAARVHAGKQSASSVKYITSAIELIYRGK